MPDYVKIVSKQIDDFVKIKYKAPKNAENLTDRIKINLKKFDIIYTLVAVLFGFISTVMDSKFYPVFICLTVGSVLAIVIGEMKIDVPIGDKKYRIKEEYCQIACIVVILLCAYYTETTNTLIYYLVFTAIVLCAHGAMADTSIADKMKE